MTMTNRQFFEAIAANATLAQELRDFAVESIVKLDKKNAQRKSAESKTAKENKPLKKEILDLMSENEGDTYLAADIAAQFGYSTQKASALLGQLAKEGMLSVEKVKVKGKGMQNGYTFVTPTQALENEITV